MTLQIFMLCLCLQLNDNLLKNEEIWKAKLLEIEERYAFIRSLLLIVTGDVFSQNSIYIQDILSHETKCEQSVIFSDVPFFHFVIVML